MRRHETKVRREVAGTRQPEHPTFADRTRIEGQAFHAFWLSGDRVVAGMQVNRWDDRIAPVEELIRGRQSIDPDRLADSSVPLAAHVLV
ncbi:oxidoreductase C-terminal domain-containing protein [Kribbella sp. NPDC023972]|uniref:oxidoreductase C-terminal domain-containing protein n=1 Tax=Kribbella sp. NPDC023972 TaxID=3154795 RepID=UPI0034040E0B